jgi:hypothetical protein
LVVPKGAENLEPSEKLIDTWELMYQINEQGQRIDPGDDIRVLMQFTEDGRILMNWFDVKTSETLRSIDGSFKIEGDKVTIRVQAGNEKAWPYSFKDGKLILLWPSKNLSFIWRRL